MFDFIILFAIFEYGIRYFVFFYTSVGFRGYLPLVYPGYASAFCFYLYDFIIFMIFIMSDIQIYRFLVSWNGSHKLWKYKILEVNNRYFFWNLMLKIAGLYSLEYSENYSRWKSTGHYSKLITCWNFTFYFEWILSFTVKISFGLNLLYHLDFFC